MVLRWGVYSFTSLFLLQLVLRSKSLAVKHHFDPFIFVVRRRELLHHNREETEWSVEPQEQEITEDKQMPICARYVFGKLCPP